MAFWRATRVVYLHPPEEKAEDESVLIGKQEKTCYEVGAHDSQSLRKWLQEDLGAEYVLVPGQGWTAISTMTRQTALPEEFTIHVRAASLGKRTRATALDTPTRGNTTKRLKALEEYKPVYVDPQTILGSPGLLLSELRWLHLLVEEGKKVSLDKLRTLRQEKIRPKESEYYPGVLAMLKSASLGQQGLYVGGQGYGNVQRADIQGIIKGEERAPSDVKVDLKMATDKDPHGIEANAASIKQEADYLKHGIELTTDSVRMGCLFSRMDRFFIVKFERDSHSVKVTPSFPPAQKPIASPQVLEVSDQNFILMRLAWLDKSRLRSVTLSDVLPAEPTPGFRSLVAFVEELRRLFQLDPSSVRFVSSAQKEIHVSELTVLAYSSKTLVLLRRVTGTVVKVCLPENAANEIQVHNSADGHENIRSLINHGRVDVGSIEGVFHFLELEQYGEPLCTKHLDSLEATEKMWIQAYSALEHLHSCGVLHRDVKPDNMIVANGVLKLNDFDVSCFKGDGQDASEVVGTAGFQSPSGMSPYVEDDDVLSLALAFYYAKSGVAVMGKDARFLILKSQLNPQRFPACMRQAVLSALTRLALV